MKLSRRLWFYLKTANVYFRYKIKRPIPFLVMIAPTLKCNLRCKYCSIWKKSHYKEIDLNKLYELIDEISALGVPFISFTGGEPLLINDIEKIGAYAMKKNIMVNLNTNGILIDRKRAIKIAKSFDQIRISLDGLEETHDKLSGQKGTFEKVKNALTFLNNVKNKKATIGLNYVLSKKNKKGLNEFTKQFKDKVDFISYLPEFNFGCKTTNSYIAPENLKKNYEKLKTSGKNGNSWNFLSHSNLLETKQICDAGKLYMVIYPQDFIYVCPFPTKNHELFFLGHSDNMSLKKAVKKAKNNYSESCYGCHATCTTEVSKIFRMSPWQLIKNFNKLKQTYHIK